MVCQSIYVDFNQIERNRELIIESFNKHTKGHLKKIKKQFHVTGVSFAGDGNFDKTGGFWSIKFKDGFDYKIDYTDGHNDFVWAFNK